MPLITVDELTAYMGGVQLTTDQHAVVEQIIIPGIQQDLELYLNRPVEPILIRESVRPDFEGWVTLRVSPVWRIKSVRYSDGNIGTVSNYIPPVLSPDPSVTRTIDYSVQGMPALPFRHHVGSLGLSVAYAYGLNNTYVLVEYIAGYIGLADEAMKLAMLRVGAREVQHLFDDVVGLRSGTLEASQTSDDRAKGWQKEELERFKRIKRRVIR